MDGQPTYQIGAIVVALRAETTPGYIVLLTDEHQQRVKREEHGARHATSAQQHSDTAQSHQGATLS